MKHTCKTHALLVCSVCFQYTFSNLSWELLLSTYFRFRTTFVPMPSLLSVFDHTKMEWEGLWSLSTWSAAMMSQQTNKQTNKQNKHRIADWQQYIAVVHVSIKDGLEVRFSPLHEFGFCACSCRAYVEIVVTSGVPQIIWYDCPPIILLHYLYKKTAFTECCI